MTNTKRRGNRQQVREHNTNRIWSLIQVGSRCQRDWDRAPLCCRSRERIIFTMHPRDLFSVTWMNGVWSRTEHVVSLRRVHTTNGCQAGECKHHDSIWQASVQTSDDKQNKTLISPFSQQLFGVSKAALDVWTFVKQVLFTWNAY